MWTWHATCCKLQRHRQITFECFACTVICDGVYSADRINYSYTHTMSHTTHAARPYYTLRSQVPDCLGDNKALTNLDLSGNAIKSLPDTINSLSLLTSLDVSCNQLDNCAVLPVGRKERGSRLVSLEVLRLDSNRLTVGPAAVETLKTLTELECVRRGREASTA